MKTKWFVIADMGEGPSPLMTSSGKVALIEDLSGITTLMKERGAIRWQAYVWVFPSPEVKTVGVVDEMRSQKVQG
jgi:hypothetical protein